MSTRFTPEDSFARNIVKNILNGFLNIPEIIYLLINIGIIIKCYRDKKTIVCSWISKFWYLTIIVH